MEATLTGGEGRAMPVTNAGAVNPALLAARMKMSPRKSGPLNERHAEVVQKLAGVEQGGQKQVAGPP